VGYVLSVLIVLVLVAAAFVIAAWAMVKRARRRLADALPRHADPLTDQAGGADPHRLKPGDVVQMEGKDWVVRGSLSYDEDGYRWQEHLLDASGVGAELRRWLSVEDTEGGTELVLWDRLTGTDLQPGGTEVVHDGVTYRRDETGRAGFSAVGTTGTAPAGTMEYADYRGAQARLSFERWSSSGSWEVSTGRPVAATSLTILHA
jgi:hypothetical protein